MSNNLAENLFIVTAPSGAGKTSIVKYLVEQDELNLGFSISATSREKRSEEKTGQNRKQFFQTKIELWSEPMVLCTVPFKRKTLILSEFAVRSVGTNETT